MWNRKAVKPYIVLKLTQAPHSQASSPRQRLLFINRCLHPRNARFSLGMVYTHEMLISICHRLHRTIFHASDNTPTLCLFFDSHFVNSIYGWCIYQLHPPCSSSCYIAIIIMTSITTVHIQMQIQGNTQATPLFKYESFINFWLRFFDTSRETILKSLS